MHLPLVHIEFQLSGAEYLNVAAFVLEPARYLFIYRSFQLSRIASWRKSAPADLDDLNRKLQSAKHF
jgi:hypothetical protein